MKLNQKSIQMNTGYIFRERERFMCKLLLWNLFRDLVLSSAVCLFPGWLRSTSAVLSAKGLQIAEVIQSAPELSNIGLEPRVY